jgi:ribosomal protein S6--L-glutamate ligase
MLIYILSRYSNSYSTSKLNDVALSRGHEVKIIDHHLCEFRIGETSKIFYKGAILKTPDFIIPRVGASSTFQGANAIRQFEIMGVKTLVSSQGLLNSRDKFKSLQILSFNNIAIPQTYFSSGVNNLPNIIDVVGAPPFIIKVLEGTQGLGVYLATDIYTARTLIDSHTQMNANFLVQRYIKESKGTDVRAFVVGGKVIASMRRIAPSGEFRSNIHRGGIGEKIILTKKEEEIAIKSAQVMNLTVAGVDILQSNDGPLVLEVNSSPGLEGIEKYSKIEVSEKIIDFIENK